ncbi:MAG: Kelch repeat-containing protein [Thermomicrobiales bacterium]
MTRTTRLSRWLVALGLIGAFLAALPPASPTSAADAMPGSWLPTAPARALTNATTATVLADGRVFVTAYAGEQGQAAEIYDPATDSWQAIGPIPSPRLGQYIVAALHDGRVLIAGSERAGDNVIAHSAPADIYDPATGLWSQTAPTNLLRYNAQTATVLADGRVLVVGGWGGVATAANGPITATAELYDPATNAWTLTGSMAAPRAGHSATLLPDGQVMVIGGYNYPEGQQNRPLATVERYNAVTGQWTTLAPLSTPRDMPRTFLLPDGDVLVFAPGDRSERYHPADNRWTVAPTPPLPSPGADLAGPGGYVTALLPDGRILAAGGTVRAAGCTEKCIITSVATAYLYDFATNQWTVAAPLAIPRGNAPIATLPDGRIIVVGGDQARRPGTTITAEIYATTPLPPRCFPVTGQCIAGRFLTYWLAYGGLAVNGYPLSGEFMQTLEDGHTYVVQYFERARFEHHPENQPPYDVELGQFGRHFHPADPPVAPLAGQRYFPQTGHNLGDPFKTYWERQGGLAQFGFPISEVFSEQLEDGNTYQVQYFERARFELHPENNPPYDILLGQFGRRVLNEVALNQGR